MVLLWIFAEYFVLLDYINFLFHHNSSNRKEWCLQSLYSAVNFSQAHPNPLSWLLILLWPKDERGYPHICQKQRGRSVRLDHPLSRSRRDHDSVPRPKVWACSTSDKESCDVMESKNKTMGVRQFSWQWRKLETGQCCHRRLRWDIPEYQLKLTEKVTWPLGTTGSHV